LLNRFINGDVPSAVDIPTGLGKTSVMAVWLVARAYGGPLPRRLVYIVDRRAVVDQATEEAERLRKFVEDNPSISSKLGLDSKKLPVSTLRGQLADNREWLEDPSLLAILVGTVDMIGSRLLFEGYRVSRKMRPYHAGLLGADTLAVLDEAHLVPPFEQLLEAIGSCPDTFGPADNDLRKIIPAFKLLSLSATGRNFGSNCHGLEEDDLKHEVVKKRLNAKKRLLLKRLAEVLNAENEERGVANRGTAEGVAGYPNAGAEGKGGEGSSTGEDKNQAKADLAEALSAEAWSLTGKGTMPFRILIFCDKRKVAEKVEDSLTKKAKGDRKSPLTNVEIETELFVGERRVFEREKAKERLKQLGFLAGSKVDRTKPAFLIATSAAEVGVDLDADHMVCDLAPWERMVQRLGRVNRRGEGDAIISIVAQAEPKDAEDLLKKPKQDLSQKEAKAAESFERLRAVAKVLNQLAGIEGGRNASPGALRQLKEKAKEDADLAQVLESATTPSPLRPPLTRAVVDAWAMTSLEEHTGRPAIGPWLRGWSENDPPQTAVVWRRHLPVSKGRQPANKEIEGFFEAAPPHTSELLETETYRVIEWLGRRGNVMLSRATRGEDGLPGENEVVAFVLAPDLTIRRRLETGDLANLSREKSVREQLESELGGATLVVDARLGGLRTGLLQSDEDAIPPTADAGGETWHAEGVVGFRVRSVPAGAGLLPRDPKWHERLRFAAEVSSEGEPIRWLVVEKWRDDAATEDDRSASRPQSLDEHQSCVEDLVHKIAMRLGLDKAYEEMLATAARFHDEGKRAKRWQQAFNAPRGSHYAKTEGPINYAILDGYRHEFGSLPFVEHDERLKRIPEELRELALHLVAAHHGFARPIIGTSGSDDAPPTRLQERAREVALRFARLQRRWGPWGLAWWEALLRAADQQASRKNAELPAPTEMEVSHG